MFWQELVNFSEECELENDFCIIVLICCGGNIHPLTVRKETRSAQDCNDDINLVEEDA